MRSPRTTPALLLSLAVVLAPGASAHTASDVRIADLDRRIETAPAEGRLYLERGEIYREAHQLEAALADYSHALRLDPDLLAPVELARGLVQLESGDLHGAQAALDRLISLAPDSVPGRIARARVRARLGQIADAAADYDRAIDAVPAPKPDWYIERARLLAGAGRLEEALAGLDDGLAKLGPAVSLDLEALDLEARLGDTERALARLDRIAGSSPRQETWLLRKGAILDHAGRTSEACEAYGTALGAVIQLPDRLRRTRAAEQLEHTLRQRLAGDQPQGNPE